MLPFFNRPLLLYSKKLLQSILSSNTHAGIGILPFSFTPSLFGSVNWLDLSFSEIVIEEKTFPSRHFCVLAFDETEEDSVFWKYVGSGHAEYLNANHAHFTNQDSNGIKQRNRSVRNDGKR